MLSKATWDYISSLKTLTVDNSHHHWKLHHGFNAYLSQLPWETLDRPLQQDCLLYNVDSKGALHLLGVLHVVRIRTRSTSKTILYKYDAQHARLHVFRVPREQWSMVGLMAIST
jgi:hypothetical protein